jgi:hypothetical protein
MRRHLLLPASVLVLVLALGACSSDGDSADPAPTTSATSATSMAPTTSAGVEDEVAADLSPEMAAYSAEVVAICTGPMPNPPGDDPASLATFVSEAVVLLGDRVTAIEAVEVPAGQEDEVHDHLVEPLAASHQGMEANEDALVAAASDGGADGLMSALMGLSDEISPSFSDEDLAWLSANGMAACGS